MPIVDAAHPHRARLVLSAWSCWWLGDLNQYAGVGDVFWPRMIQGFGMGLTFVPVTTVMLAPLPKNELASATGVSMLVRQLGASVGIAVLTTLLAAKRRRLDGSCRRRNPQLTAPRWARSTACSCNRPR